MSSFSVSVSRSVDAASIMRQFRELDSNRDNALTQSEIASGLGQMQNYGTDNFWGTLVHGGTSGRGLFPDANRDGVMTDTELFDFANADGNQVAFSSEDFQAAFGSQARGSNALNASERPVFGLSLDVPEQAQLNNAPPAFQPTPSPLSQILPLFVLGKALGGSGNDELGKTLLPLLLLNQPQSGAQSGGLQGALPLLLLSGLSDDNGGKDASKLLLLFLLANKPQA